MYSIPFCANRSTYIPTKNDSRSDSRWAASVIIAIELDMYPPIISHIMNITHSIDTLIRLFCDYICYMDILISSGCRPMRRDLRSSYIVYPVSSIYLPYYYYILLDINYINYSSSTSSSVRCCMFTSVSSVNDSSVGTSSVFISVILLPLFCI